MTHFLSMRRSDVYSPVMWKHFNLSYIEQLLNLCISYNSFVGILSIFEVLNANFLVKTYLYNKIYSIATNHDKVIILTFETI